MATATKLNARVIRSDERHFADHGWLQTHWHFSFSDYYDPQNMNFGPLRVFNDDVVRGGGGFDFHPHRDMEIVSYIIDGALEHQDLLGNRHVNRAGEVQVMSAGRGIVHAESNPSASESMRLLQLWILPRHRNLPPRWEQRQFSPAQRAGRLLPVVSASDGGAQDTLKIDQDATIYVSSLKAGERVEHRSPAAGRKAYLFVIDGTVTVNGELSLSKGDQARIVMEDPALTLVADADAELILLDVPALPE